MNGLGQLRGIVCSCYYKEGFIDLHHSNLTHNEWSWTAKRNCLDHVVEHVSEVAAKWCHLIILVYNKVFFTDSYYLEIRFVSCHLIISS
jgi:hypothetical protein